MRQLKALIIAVVHLASLNHIASAAAAALNHVASAHLNKAAGALFRQPALLPMLSAGMLEVERATRGHSHPSQPKPQEHPGQHRGHL